MNSHCCAVGTLYYRQSLTKKEFVFLCCRILLVLTERKSAGGLILIKTVIKLQPSTVKTYNQFMGGICWLLSTSTTSRQETSLVLLRFLAPRNDSCNK